MYIFPDCDALNQRDQNVLLEAGGGGSALCGLPVLHGDGGDPAAHHPLPAAWEWKLRGGTRTPGTDTARDLCRVFASGQQLLPVSQYLVGLENKRLKREQLQQLLEAGWRAAAEAPAGRLWKAGPGGYPRGRRSCTGGLTVRQLQGLIG